MCPECGEIWVVFGIFGVMLTALFAVLLVMYINKKYYIAEKSVRLKYLESTLCGTVEVRDLDELRCMTEYIELLVKLGFKSEEIQCLIQSCCYSNGLG